IKFDQIANIDHYDALAIMPVSSYCDKDPYRDLMENSDGMNLIRQAVEKNIPVSTICSGARVLAAAGVLEGRKVLGQPDYKAEYEKAGALFLGKDFPPQQDGCILTGARDQYYNFFIAMALSSMIESNGVRGYHEDRFKHAPVFSRNASIVENKAVWQKIIGGFGADGGRSVVQAKDGGFLITGYTFSHGAGDADILICKTDSSGKLQWTETYGGAGTEYGYGAVVLDDGYLICGYTTSFGAESKNVYVIRTDMKGNELWAKTYGGNGRDIAYACCESETGFMICGLTSSSGAGEEDVYLLSIDRDGKELWSKTFGGKKYELGNSICKLANNQFIIGAVTGTFGKGNCDIYLIRIDGNGNELWSKSIGDRMDSGLSEAAGNPFDWCSKLRVCLDGGFIMAGYSNARDIMNVFVVKTDQEGNVLWNKNIGHSPFYDYGFSVIETQNKEIVVCGTSKATSGNNDIFLAKLNHDGELLSQVILGGPGSDWGSDLCISKENRIVLTGHTDFTSFGQYDVFLLEVEEHEFEPENK
ncbi:MAG: DJ-1/PfpI family protein, partial [Planctomycetes bacterium]|nr:DJ-1/PfpI family protein [Planctomycetota bacterium]